MITVALPAERHSEQLDTTLAKLEYTRTEYKLELNIDASVNVAEARQAMIDKCRTQYICFIDYDTEIIDTLWLEKMLATMTRSGAGIVFAQELWGTSFENISLRFDRDFSNQDAPISFGPAACMLVNLDKCRGVKWDPYMGLRNGWLGGDVEEVDYCFKVQRAGHKVYRCASTAFHHTGGKTTINKYTGTDRGRTAAIMMDLLHHKYRRCPDNDEFFKPLRYIKAKDTNDLMAENGHLRECYRDVILSNGLEANPGFKKKGLI